MDEPTSALSINETERLFQVIRKLAKEGVAIVYISHRMEEVFALSRYSDGAAGWAAYWKHVRKRQQAAARSFG